MFGSKTILLVDDNPAALDAAADLLAVANLPEPVKKRSAAEALEFTETTVPDLVISDIAMTGMSGLRFRDKLRARPATRKVPFIFLTVQHLTPEHLENYEITEDGYLDKDHQDEYLAALVRMFLLRPSPPPFPTDARQTLTIHCQSERHFTVRLRGPLSEIRAYELKERDAIEFERFVAYAGRLSEQTWYTEARTGGAALFQSLFGQFPEMYWSAAGRATDSVEHRLHVCLEGITDLVKVPFEFLFDAKSALSEAFLCLRHPFSRRYCDKRTDRLALSRSFFNSMQPDEKFRILLLGSDQQGRLPHVRAEIEKLASRLRSYFEGARIATEEPRIILSPHATVAEVKDALSQSYHLVHFAGHGQPPSSLLLDDGVLTQADLHAALVGSRVRFFYVNSCSVGGVNGLQNNDHSGITDALVSAGVPSVLAFRYQIRDGRAAEMALQFYEALAFHGELDAALLDARRKSGKEDPLFLSPILVVQS